MGRWRRSAIAWAFRPILPNPDCQNWCKAKGQGGAMGQTAPSKTAEQKTAGQRNP